MKYGLTLSGGGANGAWHVGALECLHERGYDYFDVVAGVSVGALVGANANNIEILSKMWDSLVGCPEKVFTPYFTDYNNRVKFWKVIANIGKILSGEVYSLADNKPLKEVLNYFVRESALPSAFYVGLTSLENSTYYALGREHARDFESFKDAILASMAMTPFFAPVKEVKLKQGILKDCADGGLRTVSDLGAISRHINDTTDKYTVFIINCRNQDLNTRESGNILDNIIRADDIKQAEIFRNDSFLRGSEDYEAVIIEPDEGDYIPSKYDFSAASMGVMSAMGYKAAGLALDKYEGRCRK